MALFLTVDAPSDTQSPFFLFGKQRKLSLDFRQGGTVGQKDMEPKNSDLLLHFLIQHRTHFPQSHSARKEQLPIQLHSSRWPLRASFHRIDHRTNAHTSETHYTSSTPMETPIVLELPPSFPAFSYFTSPPYLRPPIRHRGSLDVASEHRLSPTAPL